MAHEGASHRKHLLLAAGQSSGKLVLALFQTRETLVNHFDRIFNFLLVISRIRTHFQVLENRQGSEHTAPLRHVGDSH